LIIGRCAGNLPSWKKFLINVLYKMNVRIASLSR
jgi:hypothetical protein